MSSDLPGSGEEGVKALSPLCHILVEDSPRQTSVGLLFCKWLFFPKFYNFLLFPMDSWAQRRVLMTSIRVDSELCIFHGLN